MWGGYAAGLSRKTTRLRFGKLRRGRQFMAPGGPPFAEASARQAVRGVERRFMGELKSGHQAKKIKTGTGVCALP